MFKQAIETDAQPTTTRRVKQAFEQVSIKITDVDMVKLVECERERGVEAKINCDWNFSESPIFVQLKIIELHN